MAVFRNVRLEVHSAGNEGMSYKVLSGSKGREPPRSSRQERALG